jgi:hypothetical protein
MMIDTSTYHVQHSEIIRNRAEFTAFRPVLKKDYNLDAEERLHFRINVIPNLCEHQCLAEHLL